jgi:hypothetical protein
MILSQALLNPVKKENSSNDHDPFIIMKKRGVLMKVSRYSMKRKAPIKLVYTGTLSALAALFQSAGGYIPGMGMLISPFATAPILICTLMGLPYGVMAYFSTIFLLFIIHPSELFIFPFTTGVLGLSIGAGFYLFKRKIESIFFSGFILTIGINLLLYIIHFPVFGPMVSTSFNIPTIIVIYAFSCFYSWIWVLLTFYILKRVPLKYKNQLIERKRV